MISFSGTIELKPHGDAGDTDSLFLGQDVPLCVAVRKALQGSNQGTVTIEVEGATTKTATGKIEIEYQLVASGAFSPLKKFEVFKVGEKDLLEYLRKAVGRKARISLT